MTHVYITVWIHRYWNADAARWSDNYSGDLVPVLKRITKTYEEAYDLVMEGEKIYEAPIGELLRTYANGYNDLREMPLPSRCSFTARRAARTRKANAARKAKTK